MDKNNRVSSDLGANFSNIRKLATGDKLGGITYSSGNWYDTIFSAFKQEMMKELSAAKTTEEKLAVINKYNSLQSTYAKLRPLFPDLSKVQFNQAVKAYQELIKNSFGFVNSFGINNGITSGRYYKEGSELRINKDTPPNWETEGYWAGQTQDRTTLGYRGDWDENSDLFRNWQSELNKLGIETFLDSDGAYKLRLIPEESFDNKSKTFDVLNYDKKPQTVRKFKFPTFPLYNAALLGVANATNRRILDTQLKAPVMRYTFNPRVATLERPYVEQQQNEQKLQEYKWDIQQLLDNINDLGKSQKVYRDIRGKELDTLMQNNLRQSDIYRQSKENVTNTVNYNKAGWDQNDNLNRQSYVADAQRKLNAIAQYQAQRGQNAQEHIISNYTDWKAWNRNNALQDYADWQAKEYGKVQADLKEAFNKYQDSDDITKFKGYDDFWKSHMIGNDPDDNTAFGRKYGQYLVSLGENVNAWDPDLRLRFFKEHMNDEDLLKEIAPLKEAYQKYQSDSARNYVTAQRDISSNWNITRDKNNIINFDGEISPWLYYKLNPRTSYERYTFNYKKGGRFLEYLEHNRKAEKDIRDATLKSIKESKKMLKRDLDALDRESLLLLRAIFK